MLIMDPDGTERWRLEGYLPRDEFRVHLQMGLARLALVKKDWAEAERRFDDIAENHPDSEFAAQAVYYRGVSRYSASHDGTDLTDTAVTLRDKYEGDQWQLRSLPWLKD